jgi:general L-amino acid transport system permease protein
MTATTVPASPARRPPPWRDVRLLRLAAQVAVVAAVVGTVGYLYDNLVTNLRIRGIPTDFDFLDRPATIEVAYSDFRATQPVRDAIVLGVKNTLLVAALGIALTIVVGTIVGVARLSTNLLVRSAAGLYVETLRNLPPILVIVFVNSAVFLELPVIADAIDIGGLLVLSNRELAAASPVIGDQAGVYGLVVAASVVVAAIVWRARTKASEATGAPHHRVVWAAVPLLAAVVGGYLLLDGPVTVSRPEVVGRGISGGVAMSIGYGAVVTGLVLYTSSHVAEIVRGSIQAVDRGQGEAAEALGLSPGQRLRYVVLPQAFRSAVPPMINQFLNLTKNSSLAIAVGYAELSALTLVLISQSNPGPQMVLILMAIYLTISIVISLIANVVNRRLQLVER